MAESEHRGRPLHRVLLTLLLVSALALRAVYAVHQPDIERFEDEKHALKNVVGIVLHGSFEPLSVYYPSPVFNLPPSALVAASNSLHRATGQHHLLAVDEQGISHSAAFLLCRLLMAVYGTLAVYLLFLVGRRLFSARVGLMAAAMLAFMPWMIHSSGSFKPDPLLVLTVLAAFHASLRAVAQRRVSPYLLAGVAIALAVSAKMTGLLIALPLTVATAMAWRDPRRWGLLAAAGLTSLATFVLLNPYWWAYPRFIAGLRVDYAMRAGWAAMTREQMPGRVLDLILGDTGHGPLIGTLALAGLLGLAIRAFRRRSAGAERVGLVMLLVFPPAYVAAYTVQTAYFKSNNFLPILPFTALAAAWLLGEAWRRVRGLLPASATAPLGWLAAGGLALVLAAPGFGYVHDSLVPSTEDIVRRVLRNRLSPAHGRSVVLEPAARRRSIWEGAVRFRIAEIEVEHLAELPSTALDLADAEVFARRRLRGRDAELYRQRIERLEPDQVLYFEPRLFAVRGPALVALIHRRTLLGEPLQLELSRCGAAPVCFEGRLPADMVPRERFSLELWAPLELAPRPDSLAPLQVGDRSVELLEVHRRSDGVFATTARLFLEDPAASAVRFTAQMSSQENVGIRLFRWAGGPRPAPRVGRTEPGPDRGP